MEDQHARAPAADPDPSEPADEEESELDKIRRIASLKTRRDELELELKRVKKEFDDLEPVVLEIFERGGMQNQTVDGVTVYLHRQLWAVVRDQDKERAVEALKRADLGSYVSEGFNSQSVSALFREWDADDEPWPEPLREAFDVSERYSIRTVKAQKGGRGRRSPEEE